MRNGTPALSSSAIWLREIPKCDGEKCWCEGVEDNDSRLAFWQREIGFRTGIWEMLVPILSFSISSSSYCTAEFRGLVSVIDPLDSEWKVSGPVVAIHHSSEWKTSRLPMDYDWIPQMDMKTIGLHPATFRITLSPGQPCSQDPKFKCQALPPRGGFHYQIYTKIHLYNFSAICSPLPEKHTQYYAPAAVTKLMWLFQSDSGWIDCRGAILWLAVAVGEYTHGPPVDVIVDFVRAGVCPVSERSTPRRKIHQTDSTNLIMSIMSIHATNSGAFHTTESLSQDECGAFDIGSDSHHLLKWW
jgi:hypothetical protein